MRYIIIIDNNIVYPFRAYNKYIRVWVWQEAREHMEIAVEERERERERVIRKRGISRNGKIS